MSTLFDSASSCNGLTEGEARRDAVHALLDEHRPEVIRQIQVAMICIGLEQSELTADDVRAVVPIPEGMSANVVGAAFSGLAKSGIFRKTGYRPSKRAIANAHNLAVWRLVKHHEALTRLAELRGVTA